MEGAPEQKSVRLSNHDHEGDSGLNYDEEEPSGDSTTLGGPSATPSVGDEQKDADDGYPREPIDVNKLTTLSQDQCKPGCFIYFKHLAMSSAGFPEHTNFRTAKVEAISGNTVKLKLARRDVAVRDAEAQKLHKKFHIREDDQNEAADEDSERYLALEYSDLAEPQLISA